MIAVDKRSVLITGCSDGGMGAELAKEFHRKGFHVYATARNASKMQSLTALGIETLALDVQSESSIANCVQKLNSLDILVNNAGALYTMPVADISIAEAKALFDTNLWGSIAMIQTCMPLLRKSPKAMIVNHTSIGAGLSMPFQAAYNASKAALCMFTDTMRMELDPFDIAIVELKTGGVRTNVVDNARARQPKLPQGSIYEPARDLVEKALRIEWIEDKGTPAERWAKEVVADLMKKSPPAVIWRGDSATLARYASFLPHRSLDSTMKKMIGLNEIESVLRKQ